MGTKNLNKELQKILNPKSKLKIEKEFGEVVFREGDKVMQIKNNYDLYWETIKGNGYGTGVFNGDLGIINKIDGNIVEVIYDDERKAMAARDVLKKSDLAQVVYLTKLFQSGGTKE